MMKKLIAAFALAICPVAAAAEYDDCDLCKFARNGDFRAAAGVLSAGADPNAAGSFGNTPLLYAATNGHDDAVWLLLQKGANPNLQNGNGATALTMAAAGDHIAIAAMLLQAGANPNAKNPTTGVTAKIVALRRGNHHMVSLLEKFRAES